jgi:hypothetical protein
MHGAGRVRSPFALLEGHRSATVVGTLRAADGGGGRPDPRRGAAVRPPRRPRAALAARRPGGAALRPRVRRLGGGRALGSRRGGRPVRGRGGAVVVGGGGDAHRLGHERDAEHGLPRPQGGPVLVQGAPALPPTRSSAAAPAAGSDTPAAGAGAGARQGRLGDPDRRRVERLQRPHPLHRRRPYPRRAPGRACRCWGSGGGEPLHADVPRERGVGRAAVGARVRAAGLPRLAQLRRWTGPGLLPHLRRAQVRPAGLPAPLSPPLPATASAGQTWT